MGGLRLWVTGCMAILMIAGLGMIASHPDAATVGNGIGVLVLGGVVLVAMNPGLIGLDAKGRARRQHSRTIAGYRQNFENRGVVLKAPTLEAMRDVVHNAGGGAYVGMMDVVGPTPVFANPRHSFLVLGPPQAGKTRQVIIPSVICAPGPVVSTSIKTDVYDATAIARRTVGRVWVFNPSPERGEPVVPPGAEELRWSPVTNAGDWDTAMSTAEAMTKASSVGEGVANADHWRKRAGDLLAPLLHAAAHKEGGSMVDVRRWIQRYKETIGEAEEILDAEADEEAGDALADVLQTPERERGSIFSTASTVLDAYKSRGAINAATDPQRDFADYFVTSSDALYITAPSHRQALAAPLIVGLLSELRNATFAAHRARRLGWHVTFALDELVNIAPLHDLDEILSQAGGQGLHLIAGVQSLAHVRRRWGEHMAASFLTLFQEKLIFAGGLDRETMETVSLGLGEHIVRRVSQGNQWSGGGLTGSGGGSSGWSEQRERRYAPGDVAAQTLYLIGVRPIEDVMRFTDFERDEPWASITRSLRHGG